MTTTVPAAPARDPGPSGHRPAKSEFGPLRDLVVARRLLDRRHGHYVLRGGLILVALLATVAGIVLLAGSWWVLLLAPAAAIVSAQISFYGHDAGHQQITASRRTNRILGLIAGNVLAGISYGWWQDKHLRHHANPNHQGLDPDVGEGVIAWSEEQAAKKTGFARWFANHQAAFFFPLLTLEGWNLNIAGLRSLRSRPANTRKLEAGLLTVHWAVYLGFLFVVLPLPVAIVFILIHRGLYGLNLGAAFAPNHKGMEMPPAGTRMDHLRKQVLTSRNVTGGPVVDFMLGGLNYQIEHHLFPSMPRPHLKLAAPIIRDYCAGIDLPYRACGPIESYGECLGYLRSTGRADPTAQ